MESQCITVICLFGVCDFLGDWAGTGTFGRVRLCQHKKTKQFFAMKILKMATVIRLKQVDHVSNEKNLLLELHHPYLVNL